MTGKGEFIKLTATDGHEFDAFSAAACGRSRGGLIVLQEIFGVTDQLKDCARAFATEGFDTLVPALFDRIAPGKVVPFDEIEEARALPNQVAEAAILKDIAAARDYFGAARPVSVLGFCWGGGLAVTAAGEIPLTGAVSYYGTRLTERLQGVPRCPMLFHFGESDPYSPPDVIAAVRAALPEAEIHVYAAGHAFANDARSSVYVADAAKTAWDRSVRFLKRLHGAL